MFIPKCASRQLPNVHFLISHLPGWLRARRFSEPTCRPSGATKHDKHSASPFFYLFAHLHLPSSDSFSYLIFFLLLFSSLLFSSLLISSLLFSSLTALLPAASSVHTVGSLTSKLPSIMSLHMSHVATCIPSYLLVSTCICPCLLASNCIYILFLLLSNCSICLYLSSVHLSVYWFMQHHYISVFAYMHKKTCACRYTVHASSRTRNPTVIHPPIHPLYMCKPGVQPGGTTHTETCHGLPLPTCLDI